MSCHSVHNKSSSPLVHSDSLIFFGFISAATLILSRDNNRKCVYLFFWQWNCQYTRYRTAASRENKTEWIIDEWFDQRLSYQLFHCYCKCWFVESPCVSLFDRPQRACCRVATIANGDTPVWTDGFAIFVRYVHKTIRSCYQYRLFTVYASIEFGRRYTQELRKQKEETTMET